MSVAPWPHAAYDLVGVPLSWKEAFILTSIIKMCRDNDVSMVGIFGSTARGKASASSDIDLLVRFVKPKSLLALVKLEQKLSDILRRKVGL
jgi:uncharacterized protein